jgi:hypothetical protein
MVEHLPSKCKALTSNPSIAKNQKTKTPKQTNNSKKGKKLSTPVPQKKKRHEKQPLLDQLKTRDLVVL